MDYKNISIIISAIIISLGILFSNGIYRYYSDRLGLVQRYNIFTGTIELCTKGKECTKLGEKSKELFGDEAPQTKTEGRELSQEEISQLNTQIEEDEKRERTLKGVENYPMKK